MRYNKHKFIIDLLTFIGFYDETYEKIKKELGVIKANEYLCDRVRKFNENKEKMSKKSEKKDLKCC